MIGYRMIEQIMSEGSLDCLGPDRSPERLILEIRSIRRKMAVLPTARESEALPEIAMLRDFARLLLTDKTLPIKADWQSNEKLERLFIEELFEAVVADIIKAKIYTNKEIVRTADALFCNLVAFATSQLPRQQPYYNSLINTIIDKSADYYKTNGKESSIYSYPFGELLEPDEAIRKWVDSLEKGTLVDCLKNYAGKKNWSRAVIESRDSHIMRVRYVNDLHDTYVQNRYFEIAPLNTKDSDFKWREELKVGDLVDFYNFRSDWSLYRITKVIEDENSYGEIAKTFEIAKEVKEVGQTSREQIPAAKENALNAYRQKQPEGVVYGPMPNPASLANISDAQLANMQYSNPSSSNFYNENSSNSQITLGYDPLSSQTTTVKCHSAAMAMPGKYSTRLGTQIDDSEDLLLLAGEKKQKFAILRMGTMSGSSSIYLVKCINAFGEAGGFDFILDVLNEKVQVNQDFMGQLVRIIQNVSENLVEPFIKLHGEKILKSISGYIIDSAEKNLRNLSQQNLTNVLESVASLAQRVYHSKKARNTTQLLVVHLGVLCLKSDILEKQFFGAKQLLSVETKTREFDSEISRAFLAECLERENIFEKIVKGHPGLIAKGSGVLKILLSEKKISEAQMAMLWEQICKTDVDSRSALLAMIKEILYDLSKEQIQFLVRKMLENADEITTETFDLLCCFRRVGWSKHNDTDLVNLVNDVFWEILQSERQLKKELAKEVMLNFVRSLDAISAGSFIARIVSNYLGNRNKTRNLKLLKKILKQEALRLTALDVMEAEKIVDSCADEIMALFRSKIKPDQIQASNAQKLLRNNFTSEQETGANVDDFTLADPLTVDEKFEIQLRLKFLKSVIKHEESNHLIFTFTHFEKIWEVVFASANTDDFIHEWIREYIRSDKISSFIPQLKAFFSRNYRKLLHPLMSDFFKFFMLIFHKVNINEGGFLRRRTKFDTNSSIHSKTNFKNVHLLAKPTEELFGIEAIWELFAESTTHALYSQLANYLTMIYSPPEFFENEHYEIYSAEKRKMIDKALALFLEDNSLKAAKASLILMRIVKFEERHGSGPLVSLGHLKEGEKLIINIEKDVKYLRERAKITISENQTLAELKELIAKEYKIGSNSIQLVRENEEVIASSDNCLTLESAGIRMRDLIIIRELEVPDVNEIPVLNESETDFSEQTYKVFSEIFSDYSTDGKMARENLIKFTSKATDGCYVSPNDERVTSLFEKYDKEKKGYILEADLIDFYRKAAISDTLRLNTVRQNLQSLGYGMDLRLKKVTGGPSSQYKSLLRYELCNHDSFGSHLRKYIEETHKKDAKINETFITTLELLTPSAGRIRQILDDPVATLCSSKHPDLWKYDQVLLHALVFRRDDCQKLLEAIDIDFEEAQYQALLSKVISAKFIESIFDSIAMLQRQFTWSNANFENIFSALRTVEKIFKVAISTTHPEMVNDLKNFLSFFIRHKKKITEKTQTDSPEKKDKEEEAGKGDKAGNDKEKEDEVSTEDEQVKRVRAALSTTTILISLIDTLNYKALNSVLVDLLKHLNDVKNELYKFQKVVLKSSMIILIASLTLKDQELSHLLKTDSFQRTVFAGLAHDKGLVRLHYKNFYAYLTSNSNDIRIKVDFLKILINNISNESNEEFHTLIELACNILGEIGEMKAQNEAHGQILHAEFNFSELFTSFSAKLLAHASVELAYDEREDSLLIGYLSFMEKIIKADELVLPQLSADTKKALVLFLFQECLFEITDSGFVFPNIKCKSRKSRAAAIALLVQLLRKDPQNTISLIASGLLPLSQHIPDLAPQSYGLSSEPDRKSQLGFLGLKNLGCVCYMIAMLQQFYCTPAFRHGILMASDKKPVEAIEVKGRLIDDNLFHQIQKMFAYLDFSERRDFNPIDFCLSYKDYTGQPVNVMVQQDADEFLKVIFDKLEDAVKTSPYIGVLNSVYAGKICNVIVCKGCGFEKVNEEAFNNLSLEVKNLSNLTESFEKFVEEEIISEYMCDKCKNKCDISKKALLKSLPNVLIVYLKKMVFDVDLLMNIKIHARYEFPANINLKKYMHFSKDIQGEEEAPENEVVVKEEAGDVDEAKNPAPIAEDNDSEEFEYKLVGVVIHKGNAEYGHYTSLVNVNRKDPRREQISKDLWLEFDDSRVSKFDMNHFQDECFGNIEDKDFPLHLLTPETNISKSAYILVYDKVKKSPIVFPFTPETQTEREKILDNLIDPLAVESGPDFLKTDFYNLKQTLPENFALEIEKDNSALVLEHQLLSPTFTNSLPDIFSNIDLSLKFDNDDPNDEQLIVKKNYAEAVLQILPNFLFKIYCVAHDNSRIGKIVRIIDSALAFLTGAKLIGPGRPLAQSIDHKIVNFYIENVYNNLQPILSLLTNSTDQHVRNALSDYVVCVFSVIVRNFGIQKLTADLKTEIDSSTPLGTIAEVYLVKTINILLSLVPGPDVNHMNFKKLGGVFHLLYKLAFQNLIVRNHFLQSNLLTSVYDIYLSVDNSKVAMIEKSLAPVLSLIHTLMVQIQAAIRLKEDNVAHLHSYFNFFVRIDFFIKMLKEDYLFNNYECVKALINLMASGNQVLSDQLAYFCLKGVSSTSDLDAVVFIEAIKALLDIKDELAQHRVQTIFGIPRLAEAPVLANSRKKSYSFGLGKDTSLKRTVYAYTSPFGLERGLLEILFSSKDITENSTLLLIYHVLEIAETYPRVLAHIARLPPPNYLTATFYDWFRGYSEHHLKYMSSAYSAYKPELTMMYFNTMPEKLDAFEAKLREYIKSQGLALQADERLFGIHGNVYSNYGSSTNSTSKDPQEAFRLFAFRKNYIIGKTNRVRLLETYNIEEDHFGALRIKIQLVNVALMPSKPTGATNLSIPQYCINYDHNVNKASVSNPELDRFLGGKNDNFDIYDVHEDSGLVSIMDEDDDLTQNIKPKAPAKIVVPTDTEILQDNDTYINRDYVLRISMSNKTSENYFVKVKVFGEGECDFNGELFTVNMRSKRPNFAVQNVTLNDVDGSFKGLKIAVSVKKIDNLNMKYFSNEDFTDFMEVFEFNHK